MMRSCASSLTKSLSGLGDGDIAEMGQNLVEVHNVHVFVGKIKQIRLQRNIGTIEHAFLNNRNVKARGLRVDNARTETSGSRSTANDQAAYAKRVQLGQQGSPVKAACTRLVNDHIAWVGSKRGKDIVVIRLALTNS